MAQDWMVTGGIAAISAAVSFGAGFWVAKRKLEADMIELVNLEVAEAKAEYREIYETRLEQDLLEESEEIIKAEIGVDEKVLLQEATEALAAYQGNDEPTEPLSLDDVLGAADPNGPYVISEEEFMSDNMGYAQLQLTYFVGDDVLMRDENQEVFDTDERNTIIGFDNLTMFAQYPDGEDTLYVRCDRYRREFEIERSMGKFSIEVLGLDEEAEESV